MAKVEKQHLQRVIAAAPRAERRNIDKYLRGHELDRYYHSTREWWRGFSTGGPKDKKKDKEKDKRIGPEKRRFFLLKPIN